MALFPPDKLFLIAGPCVLESDDLNRRVADHLAKLAHLVPGGVIFKASFDACGKHEPRDPECVRRHPIPERP